METKEYAAFPPTATIPVVAEPILLPDATTPLPQIIVPIRKTALPTFEAERQMQELSVEPGIGATIEVTETPPATVGATATKAPTPTPTPTPCRSTGRVVTSQFESLLAGSMTYRVYLPPCYTELGQTYPALYMLPGNIYTDRIWDELGLDEALEAGIQEKRYPPILLIMVSGGSLANYTSGGPASYETFMLEEFIPHIEQTYCAWPRREGRAIGGMSRGGYWALEIAFRHPQDFVSVGGHSAALLDFSGGPEINPSRTGLANDLEDLRVYLDIGEDDWLIANVRALHEQMEQAGRLHTWVLNEGMHEEAYWEAHVTDYLDWYTVPWKEREGRLPPCQLVPAGATAGPS